MRIRITRIRIRIRIGIKIKEGFSSILQFLVLFVIILLPLDVI